MAGAFITIDVSQDRATPALQALVAAGQDLAEPFSMIGAYLERSHDDRFSAQQSPDGTPWAPLSPAYGETKPKNQDLILILNGVLRDQLHYQAGPNELLFGSNMPYAAVHHFGAARGAFGTTSRGAPIPWGDIPARPWLGLSDDDEDHIVDVLQGYLEDAFRGT